METVMNRTWTAPDAGCHALPMAPPACDLGRERRGGVLTAIALAILCAVMAAIMPAPVEAGVLSPTAALLGVSADNNIYSIDPGTGLVTGMVSNASQVLPESTANAVAIDRGRAQIYFLGSDKNFGRGARPSTGVGRAVTALELGFDAPEIPRSDAWLAEESWFIGNGDSLSQGSSDTHHRTTGLLNDAILEAPITIAKLTAARNASEVVRDLRTRMGYGTNLDAGFLQADVSTLMSGMDMSFTLVDARVDVRLAYDSDPSALYGVNFAPGRW